MDKRKIVAAYRRGYITIKECAQLLGMDPPQVIGLLTDYKSTHKSLKRRSVHQ